MYCVYISCTMLWADNCLCFFLRYRLNPFHCLAADP